MGFDQFNLSIQKIADDLSRVEHATDGEASPITDADLHLAKFARQYAKDRRMRDDMFQGDLFADPAWDILIDLFAAEVERKPVSVSSACGAAAVPITTALRHLGKLEAAGHIVRYPAPFDGRKVFVRLSASAREAMSRWLDHSARRRLQRG